MKSKIVAIALCLFIGSGISYANLKDGLVSGYSFDDGTAKDCVGNNNGKIEGNVKVVQGKFKNALSFDGQGAYVNLGDTANFPSGSDERTVAFWTLLRGQKVHMYFMSWGSHTDGAFFGPRTDGAGNISLMVHNGGAYEDIDSDTPLSEVLEEWSHLVFTYDGATTAEIYLNGFLIYSQDAGGVLNTSTGHDAYIGGRNVGGYEYGVDATIDEVYIWDRALSEDEIDSLFKQHVGKPPLPVEPMGKLSTLWGIIKRQTR